MSLRGRQVHTKSIHLCSAMLILSAAFHVAAQDSGSSNCYFTAGGLSYDLSALGGEKVIIRTRESPPSTFLDELRFDLCAELQGVPDRVSEDQCASGASACLTTTNRKEGTSDRITSVIPLALTSSSDVETSALSSPEGIAITFHGPPYPPSSPNAVAQSLKVSLTCAESNSGPQFVSYENGQVVVEWSAPAACRSTESPKDGDNNGSGGGGNEEGTPIESVGSGLGFFFLMLLLAFAAYFALGAYYNYSTYGARGWDLIPHRDFWREVPYMLQDVVAHLCSNVRMQRSSRGGYIAV